MGTNLLYRRTPMARSTVVASLLFTLVILSSGCTWVALTPEAAEVQIGASNAIDGCTRVGTTKARTRLRIGFFFRSEKKVSEELTTLARNDAPELGGNTVVAEGPVDADGMQRFAVYDCPVGD
jgi:hypothetical protein